jgi:hypothetical protein
MKNISKIEDAVFAFGITALIAICAVWLVEFFKVNPII